MTELHHRRAQDLNPPSLDISKMIAAENDPRQRASLVVLHAISLSLEANTATVRDISEKFEAHRIQFQTHATTEQLLMSQGRGAWKVMAWVIGLAQFLMVYAWNDAREAWKELRSSVVTVTTTQVELKARIHTLEQAK